MLPILLDARILTRAMGSQACTLPWQTQHLVVLPPLQPVQSHSVICATQGVMALGGTREGRYTRFAQIMVHLPSSQTRRTSCSAPFKPETRLA